MARMTMAIAVSTRRSACRTDQATTRAGGEGARHPDRCRTLQQVRGIACGRDQVVE